jgi:hypothetical protein
MTTNLSAREVEYFPRLSFERHAHLLKSARYHALRNVSKRRHRVITSCVVEDVHFRTRDRRLSLRFSFSSSAYPISVICIIGRVGLVVVRHASLFPLDNITENLGRFRLPRDIMCRFLPAFNNSRMPFRVSLLSLPKR